MNPSRAPSPSAAAGARERALRPAAAVGCRVCPALRREGPGRRGALPGWERGERGEGKGRRRELLFGEVRTAAWLKEAAAAAPEVSLGKLVLGRGGGCWGSAGEDESLPPRSSQSRPRGFRCSPSSFILF